MSSGRKPSEFDTRHRSVLGYLSYTERDQLEAIAIAQRTDLDHLIVRYVLKGLSNEKKESRVNLWTHDGAMHEEVD